MRATVDNGVAMQQEAGVKYGARAYWREGLLAAISLALLGLAFAVDPIPQDLTYHRFADTRAVFGIPNFLNVASNAAFLLVGIAGIALCGRMGVEGAKLSWTILFLGGAIVSAGSAYYHWAPSNASLVWDRLPMTVGFMGLFVALLAEHISAKLERLLLAPALLTGAFSVAWWHYTDDLRLYAWVQFMPLVVVVLLVALVPGRYTHRRYLVYGLACYLLAKVAEALDGPIHELTQHAVSGHTAKHLLAALALFYVYLMLRKRTVLSP
jgi:hypothetical protein